MSFRDLERGRPIPLQDQTGFDAAWQETSSSVQTIQNNVARLTELAELLGTQRDTHEFRKSLNQLTEQTRSSIRTTNEKLKGLIDDNASNQQKSALGRLQKQYGDALSKFQIVSRSCASKSRKFVAKALEEQERREPEQESSPLIQHVVPQHDLDHQQGIIEERQEEIEQLEGAIAEVNEIFRDLGTMVHEQGYMLDNIEQNVANAHIHAENAEGELRQADRSQRRARNRSLVLILILGGFALIMVLIFIS